jgi:hypothetical protein
MSSSPLTVAATAGPTGSRWSEPLVLASYGHCKRCHCRSGAAASANARPAPGAFRIVAGEDVDAAPFAAPDARTAVLRPVLSRSERPGEHHNQAELPSIRRTTCWRAR